MSLFGKKKKIGKLSGKKLTGYVESRPVKGRRVFKLSIQGESFPHIFTISGDDSPAETVVQRYVVKEGGEL